VPESTTGGYIERIGEFLKHIIPGNENAAGKESVGDYINANYVNMECKAGGVRKWIAAQGPLAITVADFWRMTYER
jgi:protein tyrosine phosphatase